MWDRIPILRRYFNHESEHVALHARQAMKFIFCGASAAVLDLGSLTIFVEIFEMDPRVAYVPSTVLAVIYVFLFNKFVTFRAHGEHAFLQAVKFLAVYTATGTLEIGLSWFLYEMGVQYILAKAFSIGIIAICNYTLSHTFVFKSR
jgi:putative flippase GtrA